MSNPEIAPDISEAMNSLGIPAEAFDDGSLELAPDEQEESAPSESSEVVDGEESEQIEASTDAENIPEGDEQKEAPIEEPKLTAKEIQEIATARQAFEQEQKQWQEAMANKEKEFQAQYGEKIQAHNEFDSFLADLNAKDPDLFKLVANEFAEYRKSYSNPAIEKFQSEMAEIKKELKQFKAKASDEVTRTKLDAEVNQVKSTLGKEAEAAGIKVDYKAIEDVWADNPKLSFEEAFEAKYGKALRAAAISKSKVAQAEKKVQAVPKVPTVGAVKRSASPTVSSMAGMSWDQALNAAMKNVIGKN